MSKPVADEREAFNAVYEEMCGRPITIREIAWRCFKAGIKFASPLAPKPVEQERHLGDTWLGGV